LTPFVVGLTRAGLPFGVVREESVEPAGLEPKPLPLEGEDSTAPLGASTALGADSTALPRVAPIVPLSPGLPCANAQPDSAKTNAAVVVIVLTDFIRLHSLGSTVMFPTELVPNRSYSERRRFVSDMDVAVLKAPGPPEGL
jgi:hypothetical protein